MAGRTRVVKTRSEFEGRVSEELALVQGRDLRAWPADAELREVGRERPRVDGVQRVSGRARYNSDLVLPGMLHARVLRSPHPHARVTRIETKRAQSLPGVRAIVHRFNEADHFAEEVRFVGDHVAAVAAESEAVADDALRLIDVEYDVLPFVVDLEEAMKDRSRAKRDDAQSRGDVRKGFKDADAVVDVTYRTSTAMRRTSPPATAPRRCSGSAQAARRMGGSPRSSISRGRGPAPRTAGSRARPVPPAPYTTSRTCAPSSTSC